MTTAAAASIQVTEIAFTGYPVTDLPRARAFYEGLLGLKPSTVFEHEGKHWIEYDVGPATLAISDMWGTQWKPSPDGPIIALEVADFDAAIAALRAAGIKFNLEPIDSGVCRMAIISDPAGNAVTIHHRKSKA